MKYILRETIEIFRSSDERMIMEAMERGLHNDMFNLFERMDREIDALPPAKAKRIREVLIELLENEVVRRKRGINSEIRSEGISP